MCVKKNDGSKIRISPQKIPVNRSPPNLAIGLGVLILWGVEFCHFPISRLSPLTQLAQPVMYYDYRFSAYFVPLNLQLNARGCRLNFLPISSWAWLLCCLLIACPFHFWCCCWRQWWRSRVVDAAGPLVLGHVESRLDWINVARFVRRQIDEREVIVLRHTRIKSLSIRSRLHALVSSYSSPPVFFTDFMFWLMAIPSSE